MSDRMLVAGGCSIVLIIVSFLLAGAHQEIAWRWRELRRRSARGGMIL
jgi:hypothetical protein